MKIIKDIEHFDLLMKDNKKSHKVKFSNSVLMKHDIEQMTSKKMLGYQIIDDGIFIYKIDKDRKYLYYYLESFENISHYEFDSDVMIELIDRKHINRTAQDIKEWEIAGFRIVNINEEMILNMMDINITQKEEYSEFNPVLAGKGEIDQIVSLWENNLDSQSTHLPEREELSLSNQESILFCVMNPDSDVVSALQANIRNGRCLLSHIVVHERYRRKGLARMLIYYACQQAATDKFNLWVNEMNSGAKKLYERIGFTYSNKISIQMMNIKETVK